MRRARGWSTRLREQEGERRRCGEMEAEQRRRPLSARDAGQAAWKLRMREESTVADVSLQERSGRPAW